MNLQPIKQRSPALEFVTAAAALYGSRRQRNEIGLGREADVELSILKYHAPMAKLFAATATAVTRQMKQQETHHENTNRI